MLTDVIMYSSRQAERLTMTYWLDSNGNLAPLDSKPRVRGYQDLPVGTYHIETIKNMAGGTTLALRQIPDLKVTEKMYGDVQPRIDRIQAAFKKATRSLGVILSGAKGIGKSMFTRKLAETAIADGVPVLVIDGQVDGLARFLDSIDDEIMVVFDEFEKRFREMTDYDGNEVDSGQDALLSLFDGMSCRKKLYVVTCNETSNLNDFLLNRPGRFHYHIRFDYPDRNAVMQYLVDNLDKTAADQIPAVANFVARVPLNYDCLAAIAFELNLGGKFKDVIDDLNINAENSLRYDVISVYPDGSRRHDDVARVDMFDENSAVYLETNCPVHGERISWNGKVSDLKTGSDGVLEANVSDFGSDDYCHEKYEALKKKQPAIDVGEWFPCIKPKKFIFRPIIAKNNSFYRRKIDHFKKSEPSHPFEDIDDNEEW